MGVLVKRTGGLKQTSQLKAHLKYIGFRSRERVEEKRGFWGNENDHVDYKDFLKNVENSKGLQHQKSLKAHKIIFSLKEIDYKAYKRSGKNYKDLIRATLKEYEEKKGVKLDWIASTHDAKGHPHVHVVIKGVAADKNSDGRYKRIFFKKEDFKDIRKIFDKEFEKEVQYKGYEKLESYKDLIDNTINDIGKGFEALTKDIKRDIDKVQYKNENEKNRDIDRRVRKDKERENERGR